MMRHFKPFEPKAYVCVRGDRGQTSRLAAFELADDARAFIGLQPHWRKAHLFIEDSDGDEAIPRGFGHGGTILEKLGRDA